MYCPWTSGSAWTWSLLALLVLAYPAYLGLGESLGQRIRGVSLRQHLQREEVRRHRTDANGIVTVSGADLT